MDKTTDNEDARMDTIILGDCLQGIRAMMDECVDIIVTDPPYGIKYVSGKPRSVKKREKTHMHGDDGDARFEVYREMKRVMKPNTVAVVFCSWKNFAKDFMVLKDLYDIKNVLIWDKHDGGMGDLKHALATDYEMAIVCHKGKCPIRGKRIGSVWRVTRFAHNILHPTEKPVTLIKQILEKWSNTGEIVLDPYMGSGTTAVAAMETGRHYMGWEIDKRFHDVAIRRIKEKQGMRCMQEFFGGAADASDGEGSHGA